MAISLKESLTPTRTPPQPLPDPAATVARATPEALTHARRRLILERVLLAMIDAIPDSVLVLNPQRQILAVNRRLQEMLPRAELETIAQLCQEFNVVAVTDEIYEHITYDSRPHIPLATLPGIARSFGEIFSPILDKALSPGGYPPTQRKFELSGKDPGP